MPIAGMKKFAGELKSSPKLKIDFSKSAATASTSHGRLRQRRRHDDDHHQPRSGREPDAPPRQSELTGY